LGIKVGLVDPGGYKPDIWTGNVLVSRGTQNASSQNKERSRKYADGVKEAHRQLPDPIEVARLITRIAKDPHPKLRYRAGKDAKIGYLMRALLPWNVWESMVEKRTKIG